MSAPTQAGISPGTVLTQMINGKCVSRCLALVAELGIADLLVDGARDVEALARNTDTHPDALYRVLRMLAGVGVFDALPNQRFQNNSLSEALVSYSDGSIRNYARWSGRDFHWRVWSGLEYSARTGNPWAVKDHPGKKPFEVLAQHPADQESFNEAMAALSAADGPAIVDAYDFSPFRRIVDIGGGHATLALLIAGSAPHAKVTVFDLPHVIRSARNRLLEDGSLHQVELRGGSFFHAVPGPADLCVLSHILHDWDDESAVRILANCRDALSPNGRVLVCEMLIAPGPEAIPVLVLDVEMLVAAGGRERTQAEYSALFAAAGMCLDRIIPTRSPIRLLEASPCD